MPALFIQCGKHLYAINQIGFEYHSGMDTPLNTEQQLIADVEQLRAKYSNTQDLYREVCTVMFFRYGITPTANKLYQYVKKAA